MCGHFVRCAVGAVVAASVGSVARATDTYNFSLAPQSSLTSMFSASAPFTGSLIGNYSASNTTGTRTIPGLFGFCTGTTNQAIPISGTGGATGNPSTTPTGSFSASFDVGASSTISVSNLNINLLGGSTPTIATNVSLTYQSFRTCQPTGLFPGLTLPIDLGDAMVNTLTAAQTCSPSVAPLVHTTGNTYTFTVTTNVTLDVAFTLNGTMQSGTPTVVPVTLSGTAILNGATASITASIVFMQHQVIPGPTPALVNAPFDLPNPLGGTAHLLLTVTLGNSTVDLNGNASIVANGANGPTPCRADWNHDTFINSQDFFDFIAAFFAGTADFNCSGLVDSQDLFDFLGAFFAGC